VTQISGGDVKATIRKWPPRYRAARNRAPTGSPWTGRT
jgi:hypothetical protein